MDDMSAEEAQLAIMRSFQIMRDEMLRIETHILANKMDDALVHALRLNQLFEDLNGALAVTWGLKHGII